jgi:hypothetical protein
MSKAHQKVDWDKIDKRLTGAKKLTGIKKKIRKKQVKSFGKFIGAAAGMLDTRKVKRGNYVSDKAYMRYWTKAIRQHYATVMAAHPGTVGGAKNIADSLVTNLSKPLNLLPPEQAELRKKLDKSAQKQTGFKHLEDTS